MQIIRIMIIILLDYSPSSDIGAARLIDIMVILLCTMAWCWDTPSTRVCSGYIATRFLQNRFTAVTDWPVKIRPPGIDNGAFVVSQETVWYARVLLLFSASAITDTWSKSFDCALVLMMETYEDPENGYYMCTINIICIICIMYIKQLFCFGRMAEVDWIPDFSTLTTESPYFMLSL